MESTARFHKAYHLPGKILESENQKKKRASSVI